MTNEQLTGADAEYGYRFGCDGLIPRMDVVDFLGRSFNTIKRMCDEGILRVGKDPKGAVLICRRSVNEYIRSIQQ